MADGSDTPLEEGVPRSAHGARPARSARVESGMVQTVPEPERAFLVAVDWGGDAGWTAEESLGELAALAETAGAVVVGRMWQRRETPHPLTYLGSGKAEELTAARHETDFNLLVADDELSPKQQRALEELLNVKVLDRSGLILDIFAQRAHTHEGRLQVELAQLEYQLPRLTRLWTHLSRTGGGIGTRRGPGETQLETDRRVVRTHIKKLRERVEEVGRRRATASRSRERGHLPSVAIVGYTNAGKSTLLNALVGAEVAEVEDKLFATLDPTTRRVSLGEGQTVIATDTVGFIHKLPHQLINAFRATLEEVTRADALLVVVDSSDPRAREHLDTVWAVLDELGAGHTPRLLVLNKIDIEAPPEDATPAPGLTSRLLRKAVRVSAVTGQGIPELRSRLAALLSELWVAVDVALPYSAGELLARARERGAVELEYRDGDVRVQGRVHPSMAAELEEAGRAWKRARAEG
ncbi:MAG: GTPase HflX [Gaiellales bacterium]|nr:GTPase HflX [Gaiellales bacterium]